MRQKASKDRQLKRAVARKWSWYLPGIFLLALGVRIYAVVAFPAVPIADAADYYRLASELAAGHGYINTAGAMTAWRPPGYPIFLSCIFSLWGNHLSTATLVQAVIGSLTVMLIVIFGSAIVEKQAALVGGLLAALYPGYFWLPRLLLSENLSLLLLSLALCLIATMLTSEQKWRLVALGLLFGLSTLVRGANLFVAMVAITGLIVSLRKRRVSWSRCVFALTIIGLCFCLTMLPWTIRNYCLFHHFVPVATQDGLTLYGSYWPPEHNGKKIWGDLPDNHDPVVAAASEAGDEVATSRYLQSITVQRLREHPSYFFRLVPAKLISLAVPLDWEVFPHQRGSSRSFNVVFLILLIPALFGALFSIRHETPGLWLLWVLPVTVVIQAIFFYGSPRFRLPAESSLIIFAGVGIKQAWDFLKQHTGLLR